MFLVIMNGQKFVYNIGNDKPELKMLELYKIIKKNIETIKSKNINYQKLSTS